jgi:hypothetical protein
MASLNLPDDLRTFLTDGRRFEYDAGTCQPGRVTLIPLAELVLRTIGARLSRRSPLYAEDPHAGERGYYLVPVVSLVATCENYRPAGVLLWLPDAEYFGTWDDDHRTLWVFPGVEWYDIVAKPAQYLNACWEPDAVTAEQLRLWEMCEYEPWRRRVEQ